MIQWIFKWLMVSFLWFFLQFAFPGKFWGEAHALELDWSGQFWAEFNFVHNYAMDPSDQGAVYDGVRNDAGGYYVPGGGAQDANFQSLFLRLRPKLVVNDNIYIKSEWWVGDPIFGIFGNAVPSASDQRQYYSNQSRGSSIKAQRIWAEFISDVGTFQVGRVPLHWGLGLVWNSGEHLWDRYMSTGDAIRWIAKFGSFSLVPSFIMTSVGNNISGSFVNGTAGQGSGGVTDYSLILKYENTEDEFEIGANLLRRLAGANQDPKGGLLTVPQNSGPVAGSMSVLTYDLYAKKKIDRLSLGAEVPITNGTLGSSSYQTIALAGEASFKANDSVELTLKSGYAPGQKSSSSSTLDAYKAFYFNPSYHIGMILFNYQLANFAGPQNNGTNLSPLKSPYDNPIVNAAYLALSSNLKPGEKWTIRPAFIYAVAPQAATQGQYFYNYRTKTVQFNNTGKDQGTNLGWEFDLGLTFQWDEYFQLSLDNGIYVPGDFYAFSNTSQENRTSPVFATSVRVGVSF